LIIVSYWVGQHCDNATEKYILLLGNLRQKVVNLGIHFASNEFQACIF